MLVSGKGPDTISAQLPYNPDSFQHPYASAHNRARIVSVLLIANAALSLAALPVSLLQLYFPELASSEDEINDPTTLIVALLVVGLALIQVVLYITTIVAFLMWLYRSYENLPSFGVRRNNIEYSSGWAVGSWFIPFVSLVVPYRAVRELWRKSVPNSSEMFSDPGPPSFFPLWWAVWLVSSFGNRIYFRMSWRNQLTPDVDVMLGVGLGILDFLAAVLALMVVREIDRQQTESAKLISGELAGVQPPPPPTLDPG